MIWGVSLTNRESFARNLRVGQGWGIRGVPRSAASGAVSLADSKELDYIQLTVL